MTPAGRRRRLPVLAVATVGLLAGSLAVAAPLSEPEVPAREVPPATEREVPVSSARPLAGVRVAIDPGHQLGNSRFPSEVGRLVDAGGFAKPCNTTGTRTDRGYAEATLNFRVARLVQRRLEARGARVSMTRTSNSSSLWGPCVDDRGRFGARVGADLMVSVHADGARAGARGFHVIVPRRRSPWTTDIAAESRRLAKALRAGMDAVGVPRSTYIGNGTALSVRSDLATLNLSDVPVAMLELGNMRDPADAARMTRRSGRAAYARAVVRGIRLYLAAEDAR